MRGSQPAAAAAAAAKLPPESALFIGGGTAVAGAWELSDLPEDFDVMLAEKADKLGGHIVSLYCYLREIPGPTPDTYELELASSDIKEFEDDMRNGRIVNFEGIPEDQTRRVRRARNASNATAPGDYESDYVDITGNPHYVPTPDGGRIGIIGIAEGGAEFIGPPASYPIMHAICKGRMQFQQYENNADFDTNRANPADIKSKISVSNTTTGTHTVFPPILHAQTGGYTPRQFTPQTPVQAQQLSADFNTIYGHLFEMLALESAVLLQQHERANSDAEPISIEDFIEQKLKSYEKLGVLRAKTDDFANNFFYPFLAAQWGVRVDRYPVEMVNADWQNLSGMEANKLYVKKDGVNTKYIVRGMQEWQIIKPEEFKFPEGALNADSLNAAKLSIQKIASGRGHPVCVKDFCSHYVINYLSLGLTWNDAPQGLSKYIETIAEESKRSGAILKTDREIVSLESVRANHSDPLKFRARLKDGRYLSASGDPVASVAEAKLFDHPMISTPVYVTKDILRGINSAHIAKDNTPDSIAEAQRDLAALIKALNDVQYYDTTLAFHQDPNYRTPKGTIVHTRFDGDLAANTAEKKWKGNIMKTWVLPGQPMPKNVLKVMHHKHPKMGIEYYRAQQMLHKFQAKYPVHFGGILAGYNDSHESGLYASTTCAVDLCKKRGCLPAPGSNKRLEIAVKNGRPLGSNQMGAERTREKEVTSCQQLGCVIA